MTRMRGRRGTLVAGLFFLSAGSVARAACTSPAPANQPRLARDVNTRPVGSRPADFATIGGITLFSAWTPLMGVELWRTDGTPAGTSLVRDIDPTGSSVPMHLVAVGGFVYFSANDGVSGHELWRSDGTAAGTTLVADIEPGPGSGSPNPLADVSGTLWFAARTDAAGLEPWRSDGTTTVQVADLAPGPADSTPRSFTASGGITYFVADVGPLGQELWRSDGTPAGTLLVADLRPSGSSSPHDLVDLNGSLRGTAFDGYRVKSFPDWPQYIGGHAVASGGHLIFDAFEASSGWGLWASDGSSVGTVQLAAISPGGVRPFADLDGVALVAAGDGVTGAELWRTDGTAAGTFQVSDIQPGPDSSYPDYLARIGDRVYFAAMTQAEGSELWVTDGTAAGTHIVKDIVPGPASSDARYLVAVGNTLYFEADDGVTGYEPWRSDGTAAGTALVADLWPGPFSSRPGEFVGAGCNVYFTGRAGRTSRCLCPRDVGRAGGAHGQRRALRGDLERLPSRCRGMARARRP